MTLQQQETIQTVTENVCSSSLRTHQSDPVLKAYRSLPTDRWSGCHDFAGGTIIFPDPARADGLLRDADAAMRDRRPSDEVLQLVELAIRLDYIAALDKGEPLVMRAWLYDDLGRPEPLCALELYSIGYELSRLRPWLAGATAYWAAADLDPPLAWHLNNHAWMLATAVDPDAWHAEHSVALAESACAVSGWGCWAFLGTLAAAFARGGDFRRVVAWQRIAMHLAPRGRRGSELLMLRRYEEGRPWVDDDPEPAAGGHSSDEEPAAVDPDALMQRAAELIDAPRPGVH
jgi:hypothetical protein